MKLPYSNKSESINQSLVRMHQRCRDHFIVLSVWVHMTQMASVWTTCIFASKLKYSGKSGNLRMFWFSRRPDYIPLEISRCPGSFYMFKCSAAGKTGTFKRIDNKLPFSHLISQLVFNFAIFKETSELSVLNFAIFLFFIMSSYDDLDVFVSS